MNRPVIHSDVLLASLTPNLRIKWLSGRKFEAFSSRTLKFEIRKDDDPELAYVRGEEMLLRIYKGKYEDIFNATDDGSLDYSYIAKRINPSYNLVTFEVCTEQSYVGILYGQIFSFDLILKELDTSIVLVSSLVGMDCQGQLENQMRGMLLNGGSKEEVEVVREICLTICERYHVKFKSGLTVAPESI